MADITEYPKGDGNDLFGKDVNKGMYQIFDNFEQENILATNSAGTITYSAERDKHLIRNTSASTVYVEFDDTATTNSYPINYGDYLNMETNSTYISFITSAGSAVVKIIGQS